MLIMSSWKRGVILVMDAGLAGLGAAIGSQLS